MHHSNIENRNVFLNIKAVRKDISIFHIGQLPTERQDNYTFFHFWPKVLCQMGREEEELLVLCFCFQIYPKWHQLSKTWLFYSEMLNRKSHFNNLFLHLIRIRFFFFNAQIKLFQLHCLSFQLFLFQQKEYPASISL